MSKVRIITDPGSCHLGKLEYAKDLIKISADCGADSCKFQLFKNKPPNIDLPREWFPELVDYGYELGIEVFASAFDKEAVCALVAAGCHSIKISYAMNGTSLADYVATLGNFTHFYMSGDLNSNWTIFHGVDIIKLYAIPLYPIPYHIDFEDIFKRLDGFSDHTLGWIQTLNAVQEGATVIEKHIRLESDECLKVPDGRFALKPKDLENMVLDIRQCSA